MYLKILKNWLIKTLFHKTYSYETVGAQRRLKEIFISLEDSDDCLYDDAVWNTYGFRVYNSDPVSYLSSCSYVSPMMYWSGCFDLFNTISGQTPKRLISPRMKRKITRRRKLKWKSQRSFSKRYLGTFA